MSEEFSSSSKENHLKEIAGLAQPSCHGVRKEGSLLEETAVEEEDDGAEGVPEEKREALPPPHTTPGSVQLGSVDF